MAVGVIPRWSDRNQHRQMGEPVPVAALEDWPFPDADATARWIWLGGVTTALLAAALSLWPTMIGGDARPPLTAPRTPFTAPRPADEAPPAEGSQPVNASQPANASHLDWAALAGVVRDRFALAAAVQGCQHTENLYGYELLLGAVPAEHRAALVAARAAGAREPVPSTSDPDQCGATLDKLAAADDRLVVLAEKVKRDQP